MGLNWTPEAIKALRQRLGLTQAAMADRLGVTRAYVAHLERGHAEPGPTLCRLLDMITAALTTP